MNLKIVFYVEACINIITAILCFFWPEVFIQKLIPVDYGSFGPELVRWYGVLLVILAGTLLMAVRHPSFEPLKIILVVNLFGDWLQIGITTRTAIALNMWSFGLIFTIVVCLFLFVLRVAVLRNPKLAGYKLKT